jgi:hypothetical protein
MGWVVSVTPRPRFSPGERIPGTHCTRGWVGPRVGLDAEARGKILTPLPGIEPRSPAPSVRRQTLYWLSYPAPFLSYTFYISSTPVSDVAFSGDTIITKSFKNAYFRFISVSVCLSVCLCTCNNQRTAERVVIEFDTVGYSSFKICRFIKIRH